MLRITFYNSTFATGFSARLLSPVLSRLLSISASVGLFCAALFLSIGLTQSPLMAQPALAQDVSPLLIGETPPDLQVQDALSNPIQLHTLLKAKPTVLIFYRGGFCPYCNTQLSEMQRIEQDIVEQGYQIVAVSPDSPDNLQNSLRKNKLNYLLLSDSQLQLSTAFGLTFQAPEGYAEILLPQSGGVNTAALLPVPAIFVLNTDGSIEFEYISPNYKKRLNPDLLLAVLEALRK